MAESKTQNDINIFDLSKQLRDILDEVLATGDWQSSLLLKTVATKLQDLREKSDKLFRSSVSDTKVDDNAVKDASRKAAPLGYFQVFILLYQLDGADLQGWHRTVKTLTEYGVTRPVYKEEDHVKEFIRSKTATPDRNGYAVVNVKEGDVVVADAREQSVDQFGHPLCVLKEGVIKLENIVEFVHSNKRRYVLRGNDNELVFLGEL